MADLAGFAAPEPGHVLIITCDSDGAVGQVDVTREKFGEIPAEILLELADAAKARLRGLKL